MRIIRIAYSAEEMMLARYLKGGPDVYDYAHRFEDYLEDEAWDEESAEHPWYVKVVEEGEDGVEACHEWIDSADEKRKAAFVHWLRDHGKENTYDSPAYEVMGNVKYGKPGWLVHFTGDAWGIADSGFLYGHEGFEGLHLTTWKVDRQKGTGYNFAFDAGNASDIRGASGKYGNEMVVFWSSGVEADHSGDEERQVMFWGPSVRTDMIFPVVQRDGEWQVASRGGRRLYSSESVMKVIGWVEDNWRMLQKVQKAPAVREGKPRGKAASVTSG